ncbi:hypothetical protein TRVL_00353 [Trypanosoma vivax]|nr:hypothetical protein TRVL_00353 [Trypanosoma vivax]
MEAIGVVGKLFVRFLPSGTFGLSVRFVQIVWYSEKLWGCGLLHSLLLLFVLTTVSFTFHTANDSSSRVGSANKSLSSRTTTVSQTLPPISSPFIPRGKERKNKQTTH